jgi:hypothetical protein
MTKQQYYYTLYILYEHSDWGPEFGDNDRDVVEQEREDSYENARDYLIVKHPADWTFDQAMAYAATITMGSKGYVR